MKKITLLIFATIFSMQLDAQTITLASDSKKSVNPLLSEWKTPYQTPPFNQIKTEHYLPAFTACINLAKKDIETIDKNPEAPTFQNTIVALDRAGQKLTRISGIFFNILECDATPGMQKIAADIQPLLTEYSNSIYLDEILFNKVKTGYEKEYWELKDVDKMLLKNTYDAFLDNGANLPKDKKEEFKRLSIELSGLTLQFGQNALADDSGLCVDALGGAPGIHSQRFAILEPDVDNDPDRTAANNRKLLRQLANPPSPIRAATRSVPA